MVVVVVVYGRRSHGRVYVYWRGSARKRLRAGKVEWRAYAGRKNYRGDAYVLLP